MEKPYTKIEFADLKHTAQKRLIDDFFKRLSSELPKEQKEAFMHKHTNMRRYIKRYYKLYCFPIYIG